MLKMSSSPLSTRLASTRHGLLREVDHAEHVDPQLQHGWDARARDPDDHDPLRPGQFDQHAEVEREEALAADLEPGQPHRRADHRGARVRRKNGLEGCEGAEGARADVEREQHLARAAVAKPVRDRVRVDVAVDPDHAADP